MYMFSIFSTPGYLPYPPHTPPRARPMRPWPRRRLMKTGGPRLLKLPFAPAQAANESPLALSVEGHSCSGSICVAHNRPGKVQT